MNAARWRLAALIVAIALAAFLAPYDPQTTGAGALLPPSPAHLLGTDTLGRDVFSRLLAGGIRTLAIGAGASGLALTLGVALALAALLSVWLDRGVRVLLDALLALPSLLVALVVLTAAGAGAGQVILAVGISLMTPCARVVRAALVSARVQPHVESARALGANEAYLVRVHLLPNAAPTITAYAGVLFSYALLNSAILTALGFGGALGVPDWGTMLYEGRAALRLAPWISFAPGAALTALVALVNAAASPPESAYRPPANRAAHRAADRASAR